MPVSMKRVQLRNLTQDEFAEIAYQVLGVTFEIHNEFGRFFDEKIYKRELFGRMDDILIEEPVDIEFEPFKKKYLLDVLVALGAIFEFKAVEALVERHVSQLLNYLMLTELPRGMMINVRPERVQHRFVNSNIKFADRTQFSVTDSDWRTIVGNESDVHDWIVAMLRDLGAGLDVSLYDEALTAFCGGDDVVLQKIDVLSSSGKLGVQTFRMLGPQVAFKFTAITGNLTPFEIHARRLLEHTDLIAIQWINVNREMVTFHTLRK